MTESSLPNFREETVESSTTSERQLDVIFYYGAYSVWQFVQQMFGLDIREVCPRVAIDKPVLRTQHGIYTVELVDNNYCNYLTRPPINPADSDSDSNDEYIDHDQHITFLLNCVNVVFNMMKEGIVREDKHILGPYGFQLDANRNLELILLANEEDLVNVCYVQRLSFNIKLGIYFEPITNDSQTQL